MLSFGKLSSFVAICGCPLTSNTAFRVSGGPPRHNQMFECLITSPSQGTAVVVPTCRKYHIIKYEPIVNHRMLHHGVAYSCLRSDETAVEALPNLGPYNRLKQGMLCEQFFMVSIVHPM